MYVMIKIKYEHNKLFAGNGSILELINSLLQFSSLQRLH